MIFIKRIISALILSTIILWVAPYIYFYSKSSSNKPNSINLEFKNTTNPSIQNFLKNEEKPRFKANISINPSVWTSEFEVDKGEKDGILVGNAVTNSQNQLLGLVYQVKSNSSLVRSITNPKTNLPVWVGEAENKGLLNGLYGYSSEVDWLRSNQNLDNKPIYTTNLSKNTAPNIFIGIAQNIQLGKSGSFYRVDVLDIANVWQTDGTVLIW
jgi:cell shape-determining protein MreC